MALDAATEAALRTFAAERRYSPTSLERWLRLSSADAAGLLGLAQELRLGENQLRDLWVWAEEVAERDGLGLAEVLAHTDVAAARRRPVSRNDRLTLVKAALRRLRFPQLTAMEERLAAGVQALRLPRTVRVMLPERLEGDALRVEILADSAAALRAAAASLLEAADSAACARLFELLAEEP